MFPSRRVFQKLLPKSQQLTVNHQVTKSLDMLQPELPSSRWMDLFPSRVSFCLCFFSIEQISKSQFFQGLLCHQLPENEENGEHSLLGAHGFTPSLPPTAVAPLDPRPPGPPAPSSSRLAPEPVVCTSGLQRDSPGGTVREAPQVPVWSRCASRPRAPSSRWPPAHWKDTPDSRAGTGQTLLGKGTPEQDMAQGHQPPAQLKTRF